MSEWLRHLTFRNACKALALGLLYSLAILFIVNVIIATFEAWL